MRPIRPLLIAALAAAWLAACQPAQIDTAELFPEAVRDYVRTSGPLLDGESGAEIGTYAGEDGEVTLRAKYVGAEYVSAAVSDLPPGAEPVQDPALGPRTGAFFVFADEYHAAWGNGDWVFVLTATSDAARRAFLAGYEF